MKEVPPTQRRSVKRISLCNNSVTKLGQSRTKKQLAKTRKVKRELCPEKTRSEGENFSFLEHNASKDYCFAHTDVNLPAGNISAIFVQPWFQTYRLNHSIGVALMYLYLSYVKICDRDSIIGISKDTENRYLLL